MVNERRKKNIILDNGMELIRWEEEDSPVSICYHPREENLMTSTHWHTALEINCMFDGVTEYHVGGVQRVISTDGVCIVNQGEVHYGRVRSDSYTGQESEIGITIHFRDSYLKKLLPGVEKLYFEIDSLETELLISRKMREIYQYSKRMDDNLSRVACITCVYQLIGLLYEKCRKNRELVPINIQKDKERIKIIIEYLNEHCGEEFTQQALADGISDILAGYIVDRTKSKHGKARVWVLRMAIPIAVSLILMFLVPGNGNTLTYVYVAVTYNLVNTICYTMTNLPYGTMNSLMTRDQGQRMVLNTYRMTMAQVGAMITNMCTIPLVNMLGGSTNRNAWTIVAVIYAVLACAMLLFCFFKTEERVNVSAEMQEKKEKKIYQHSSGILCKIYSE
ncbi:MAG: MFS transporter [Lachnospiraceae bacterium]|nr:MFS transporter [Lachnospiraceae bacterium]